VNPLRFAVIGDPVSHSKSPAMHSAAYRALGMPHTYEALRITNENELRRIVDELRSGSLSGVNVTVPYKRAVMNLVDEVDDFAELVGAANTLYVRSGHVHATNTDAPAITAELASLGMKSPVDRALVIGSGGAARAAIVALQDGREIVVRARHPEAIVAELSPKISARLRGEPLTQTSDDFDCIIQATSAGMIGADSGEIVAHAVDWSRSKAVALELIYAPPETPFLRAAKDAGLRCANGLGMLARQGALAFELWTGAPAPLDVMLAAITR